MASSIDQLVSELSTLFQKGAEEAAKSAKDQPERFGKLLDDLADTPGELIDRLKQQLNPPDWLSFMILIALQLKKIVGDALEVDVWTPERQNWAKALRLTYTQLSGGVVGRLRLAISLGGGDSAINGVVVVIENTVELRAGEQLILKADGSGDGKFFIPFGGSLEKENNGKVSASLALGTPRLAPESLSNAGLDLTVGRPTIGGELGLQDGGPEWKIFARIGNAVAPEEPGLAVKADFSRLLGALAAVIHVEGIEQSYKPTLVVSKNAPRPAFDLNERTGP